MAKLKIIIKGNPVLKQISKPVAKVGKETKKLVKDMIDTMHAENGIGISGPQVNRLLRIIIIKTKDENLAMINPVILKKSLLKNTGEEGCISIPEVFGLVKRHNHVLISYKNLDQKTHKLKARGLLARVIQHEIDHLNGILFTDKVIKYTHGEEKLKKY